MDIHRQDQIIQVTFTTQWGVGRLFFFDDDEMNQLSGGGMLSTAKIPKDQILSFSVAVLVAAIITVSIGSGASKAQYDITVEEVKVGTAWTVRAMRVAQTFGEIIYSTAQLDEISEGMLSGKIDKDLANRQFKNILATILLRFNNARDEAKEVGTPPDFRDERIQKRMDTTFEILGLAEKIAKKMIDESGQLYIEARAGNQDAADKLNEKSIRSYSSIIGVMSGMLSGFMATYHSDEANYYHYKGMVETYNALMSGLNAISSVYKTGSVDVEMLDSGHKNLELAKSTYVIGRRVLKNSIDRYSAMKMSSPKDKFNIHLVVKALRTIYESFDVEDSIILGIERFLNAARQNINTFDSESFDNIAIEMSILESKRHKLMAYRQKIIENVR